MSLGFGYDNNNKDTLPRNLLIAAITASVIGPPAAILKITQEAGN